MMMMMMMMMMMTTTTTMMMMMMVCGHSRQVPQRNAIPTTVKTLAI